MVNIIKAYGLDQDVIDEVRSILPMQHPTIAKVFDFIADAVYHPWEMECRSRYALALKELYPEMKEKPIRVYRRLIQISMVLRTLIHRLNDGDDITEDNFDIYLLNVKELLGTNDFVFNDDPRSPYPLLSDRTFEGCMMPADFSGRIILGIDITSNDFKNICKWL